MAPGQAEASGTVYTHPDFIAALGETYHPGRGCGTVDVAVGRAVYRLPWIEGLGLQAQATFVDYHEPVARLGPLPSLLPWPRGPGGRPLRRLWRLECAALGPVQLDPTHPGAPPPCPLGAPLVQWAGFPAWEDYLALLRARRVLAEDQRRRRRLEELAGPLHFNADDTATDVLPTCMAWKSGRDREAGRPALFDVEAHRRFFHRLRERGLLRASTLRGGGALLSVWLGSVHGGCWSGWVFTFNPEPALARCSPGRQLLYPMLHESWRAGHREFDFSIGLEPYKLSFATHVRPIVTAGLPPPRALPGALARRLLRRHPRALQALRALRGRAGP
jgi:hypothetical protein